MKQTESPLTRSDVEEIVGRVVGEILGEAMQVIAAQFEALETRLSKRIDNCFDEIHEIREILNPLVDMVDHHTIDIRGLQRSYRMLSTAN